MALDPSNGPSDDESPTQDGHLLAIETTLGKDALLLTKLDGVETVSRGFVYTIEMFTCATEADVRGLIGQPVTLWLRNDIETERRPLHGHVRRLTRLTADIRGYQLWRAEVAPWLWFLSHNVDCRIYQDLSIPEILRSVFDECGLTHYELRLHGQYPKLVFCVQYRESSFAFVSRLMEHVGISYWFEHEADRHLLVLGDNSTLAKFTTPQQLRLSARGDIGEIQEFEPSYEFRAGNWALNDFDFEVPTKNLKTQERTVLDVDPMKRFEIFDYPGRYLVRDKGSDLTRLRIEQEEARHCQIDGAGSWAGLDAGKRFALAPDKADPSAKQESYFLTEVRHCASEPAYFSTTEAPATYSNRFSAIPSKTLFRPERLTPWPVVEGPQTATVVGPAGENIHTDQYGRVRLLFHWDRRGKRDEHASCWIRVSQVSAGSRWGSLAIPHVGQEVIVAFLEGDPDRPIITGHVHNGNNMPPLNLPHDKDKTILRDHGDNKLIMHGKAGAQWMSLVSPRAVNLVAMRAPAKPLSADFSTIGTFKDNIGYGELEYIFDELTNQAIAQSAVPPKEGSVWQDGKQTSTGYQYDINSMAEGKINSLSLGNTNAWVGDAMNTWVGGDMSQEVVGKTDTVAHGDTTNTYHSQVTDNFDTLHEENTTWHNEFCLIHSEFTGAHIENTIGLHTEFHVGMHIDMNDALKLKCLVLETDDSVAKIKTVVTKIEDAATEIKSGAVKLYNALLHIHQ